MTVETGIKPAFDYKAPRSTYERLADYFSLAILLLVFVYTVQKFANMPETVPMHFNLHGDVDRWGSRWSVWLLPLTSIFIFVLLLLPEKVPQWMNYPVKITPENAQRQYLLARTFLKTLKLSMMIMFLIIQRVIISIALESESVSNMSVLMSILLAIVLLPIVIYMVLAIRAK